MSEPFQFSDVSPDFRAAFNKASESMGSHLAELVHTIPMGERTPEDVAFRQSIAAIYLGLIAAWAISRRTGTEHFWLALQQVTGCPLLAVSAPDETPSDAATPATRH